VSPLGLIAMVAALVGAGPDARAVQAPQPAVGHVVTIVLENKDYAATFGRRSKVSYLGSTLRKRGTLLPAYFGIAHHSLPNYLAMIAGVEPTKVTRADCPEFDCTYGADVPTLANQLDAAGKKWRGYFQDLPAPCAVPVDGNGDPFFKATAASQYATRHNPFVYFHAVTDQRPACRARVVGLSKLGRDLASADRTPAWSLVVPDLCADGHDKVCADPSQPGGYAGIDRFLRRWVPRILAAPAMKADGLLIITFDEAEDDAEHGGGRIGALLLGPAVRRGGTDRSLLDHYSYLKSMEDLFGLPHLGKAADDAVATFQSAGVFG
jgi:phosphatidylinositol-3-phosphatase